MKVLTPLSRAGLDLALSPTSRIPHLRLHIISRLPHHKAGNPQIFTRHKQERWLHASPRNFSSSVSLNVDVHGLQQEPYQATAEDVQSTYPESYATETKHSEFNDILEERHPDRVIFALLDPSFGHAFIRRAGPAAFTDALTALDPQYLIEPFKVVYRFMKPSLTSDPTYRWVRHIGNRFTSFSIQLYTIMRMRREAGHKLTLDDYHHLLDCARIMGHNHMARHVMRKMMKEDGIKPDLQCYNHFIEAHCWAHAWSKSEQWRLRVTPRILEIRSKYRRPPDLKGHRTGMWGIRYKMLTLFKEMVAEGFKGDEATFTALMTAMGRESDLSGAKSILRSVYNIDVDLLQQVDEEEVETPKFYETDSPLRPSARLLFAVAHIWGSNNETTLAFKLVDYISRQYDLQIPFHVWMHLLEWTLLLGLRRSGGEIRQGQDLGQVPHETLERLWEAMTDAPHYVEPDTSMLTMRARAQRDALKLDETLASLKEAREKLDARRRRLFGLSEQVMGWIDRWIEDGREDEILPAGWYDLRRRFLMETLEIDRDLQLLITAIRSVFKEFHWAQYTPPHVRHERDDQRRVELWKEWNSGYHSRLLEWERRRLPSLVEEYAEYFPTALLYKTSGGYIAINGKEHRAAGVMETWGGQMRKNGIIRAAIDTDNYCQMVEGMRRLPGVLKNYDHYCFICESAGHSMEDCTAHRDDQSDSPVRRTGTDWEMTRKRESRSIFITDAITLDDKKRADSMTRAQLRWKPMKPSGGYDGRL
jgi:hypothetical protein